MSHNQAVTDALGAASTQTRAVQHLANKGIFLHAVHLRVEHGMSLNKIAKRLDVPYKMVYTWHKNGLLNGSGTRATTC